MDTLILTCEVCGESVPLEENEYGGVTLPHAQDFLVDHARCLLESQD